MGFAVFPCNGKVPMTARGFHDAVREIPDAPSSASIGVRTGEGVVVVDFESY
jgi:hypothetical protein